MLTIVNVTAARVLLFITDQTELVSVRCLTLAFLFSFSFHPFFSFQAKVRELEEKCRTQSEQFNLLSKELEKFRLQAGKLDILSSSQLTGNDSPGSPTKPLTLSQLLNGLSAPSGKGTVCTLKKIMGPILTI